MEAKLTLLVSVVEDIYECIYDRLANVEMFSLSRRTDETIL